MKPSPSPKTLSSRLPADCCVRVRPAAARRSRPLFLGPIRTLQIAAAPGVAHAASAHVCAWPHTRAKRPLPRLLSRLPRLLSRAAEAALEGCRHLLSPSRAAVLARAACERWRAITTAACAALNARHPCAPLCLGLPAAPPHSHFGVSSCVHSLSSIIENGVRRIDASLTGAGATVRISAAGRFARQKAAAG